MAVLGLLSILTLTAEQPSPWPSSALLEITSQNFDLLLRRVPFALLAIVAPTTATLFPELMPRLESLASSYAGTAVSVGKVYSHYNQELLDRFQIDAFPTLLWMDGSQKWPFYASEATPLVYRGERSLSALEEFVISRSRVMPRGMEQPSEPPPPDLPPHSDLPPTAPSLPAHMLEAHECTELASIYRACMRHRRERAHKCADARHEYLVCMSGRWAVTPGEPHRELAELYAKEFAHGERSTLALP